MEETAQKPGFAAEIAKQLTNVGTVCLVVCLFAVLQIEKFADDSARYTNALQFRIEKLIVLLILVVRIAMVVVTEWRAGQGAREGALALELVKVEVMCTFVVGGAAFATLVFTKYDEHGVDVGQGRMRLILNCVALVAASAPALLRTYLRSARNGAIEKLRAQKVVLRDLDSVGRLDVVDISCPGVLTEGGDVVKMMTVSEGVVNLFDVCDGKLLCFGQHLALDEHKAAAKCLNGKDTGSYTAMVLDEALQVAGMYVDDADGSVKQMTKDVIQRVEYQKSVWGSEFVLNGITCDHEGKTVFVAATATEHRLRDDAFTTVEDLKAGGRAVVLTSEESTSVVVGYAQKLRMNADDVVTGKKWRSLDADGKKAAAEKTRLFSEFTSEDRADLIAVQKGTGNVGLVTDNAGDIKCVEVANATICTEKSSKELQAVATLILPGKVGPLADAALLSRGIAQTAISCANYVITMGILNALVSVTDAMTRGLPLLLTSRRLLWITLLTSPFAYIMSLKVRPSLAKSVSVSSCMLENGIKVFVGFTCVTLSRLAVYMFRAGRFGQAMDSTIKTIFSGQFRTVVLQEPAGAFLVTLFGLHVISVLSSVSRGPIDIRSPEMRPIAICIGVSGLLFLLSMYLPFFAPLEISGLFIVDWLVAIVLLAPYYFVDAALKRARCQ